MIYHIKGCKFGLMKRLLEPNLFKGDELCTFRTMQKMLGLEHIPNKINDF
jgi:hypothetical protein